MLGNRLLKPLFPLGQLPVPTLSPTSRKQVFSGTNYWRLLSPPLASCDHHNLTLINLQRRESNITPAENIMMYYHVPKGEMALSASFLQPTEVDFETALPMIKSPVRTHDIPPSSPQPRVKPCAQSLSRAAHLNFPRGLPASVPSCDGSC